MDPTLGGIIIAALGAAAGIGSVVWSVIKGVGTSKRALDARIDARVETQLQSAWNRIDELEREVRELKQSEDKTRRENRTVKAIVRNWVTRLVDWDKAGRPGELPIPSMGDLRLLEIDPAEFGPTQPSVHRVDWVDVDAD